ncbi:hypothetical protein LCGC14_2888300, partial [marine sediment metagenome]
SSTQDKEEWLTYVQSRREEFAEPRIVHPFVDRCIEYGILPKAGEDGYTIQWQDLFAISEKERVEIGKNRSEALSKYAASPMAEMTIPPDEFLKYFLGLTKEQVELIQEAREAAIKEEEVRAMTPEEEEIERQVREGNRQQSLVTQLQVSPVDWKKVYEDGGAHWMEDLQPSKFAQEFAQKLVAEGKESVLEIGSANGKDSILFAIAGLNVTGIDIVPEAVTAAKENAERVGVQVDFQEGNAEELSFSDSTFDAVYSLSVLHSTDIKKSLEEIARVLKPEGIASIFIYSDVEKIDGEMTEFVSMDEFIEILKTNGFEIIDLYTSQDEEYDEAGEKHSIIVVEVKK